MTTLARRALPWQRQLMRVVAGHARLIFAARVEALADALRAIGKALD